jgi:hypothetical protein
MFLDNFFGAIIFQFTGASVRWILGVFTSWITGKEKPSYIEIYDGKNENESHIFSSTAFLNGVVGLFFGFGLLCLIVWLSL